MSSEGSGLSAALPSGGGHWGATQLLLQTHLQCTETQGEDALTTHTHTHTPKPSGLLLAININARVFVYAAPASRSGWSLISEVQHWASHPEERAAKRPRWTRKPGKNSRKLKAEVIKKITKNYRKASFHMQTIICLIQYVRCTK